MEEALEEIRAFEKKTKSLPISPTPDQVKKLLGEPLRTGPRYWGDENVYWTYFEYLDDSNYAAFEVVFTIGPDMAGPIQQGTYRTEITQVKRSEFTEKNLETITGVLVEASKKVEKGPQAFSLKLEYMGQKNVPMNCFVVDRKRIKGEPKKGAKVVIKQRRIFSGGSEFWYEGKAEMNLESIEFINEDAG